MIVEVIELERRDCPAQLIAHAGPVVPFDGFEGPVERTAVGNFEVFTADLIPHVKAFADGQEVASFYAYDPAFRGGVNLATDGERIATGTDRGAPHVREFTLHGVEVRSFFQGSPDSMGGARVSYAEDGGDRSDFSSRPEAPYQIYLDGASAVVGQGVADIFATLAGVGVTNSYPDQADPRRIATVIFGGVATGPERGFAIVGGVFQQSEFTSYPARVFSESLTEAQQIRAAAHEAAHLFGAVHLPGLGQQFLMFEGLEGGLEFDSLNLSILGKRLGRD
jgi:hypothetical protein